MDAASSQPESDRGESAPADPALRFHPNQIVFLEHGATRLYAEVVQVVTARRLCWVRPLALVTYSDFNDALDDNPLVLQDLRQGSDLMCPIVLFQEAIDVEVIPLLARLSNLEKVKMTTAHVSLHEFIQSIWKARPDAFATS